MPASPARISGHVAGQHALADVPTAAAADPKVKASGFHSDLAGKIERLVDTYGVTGLATLLGVSKSQPSRWRSGHEQPSPPVAQRVLALEYLTSRLAEELTPYQAQLWLRGSNAFLNGAKPAEVFTHYGLLALEPAIAALEVGAMV